MERITFHEREWQLFVHHGCQATISEKTFTLCECACVHMQARICLLLRVLEHLHEYVYVRSAHMPTCKSFCIRALMVNTAGKGCVHVRIYF